MRRGQYLVAGVTFIPENPGPAKHVEDVYGVLGQLARDVLDLREHPIQGLRINLQRGFGPLHPADADRAVHLSALQVAAKTLAKFRLRGPQLVGQPEARLQEPVVHTAQFAYQSAPGPGDLTSSESGHAGNHSGAISLDPDEQELRSVASG